MAQRRLPPPADGFISCRKQRQQQPEMEKKAAAAAEEQEGDEACLRRVEPWRPGSRGVAGLHHQDRST
uniref:Uncharacterized protein n=1 Tax=Oryza sativa subsp. japonica TaxID=39947 RepID=H2KWM1_ORYSJ|nr:hypothetical protein LOC_Os12g32434 [Oryza sativa Japonica Group]